MVWSLCRQLSMYAKHFTYLNSYQHELETIVSLILCNYCPLNLIYFIGFICAYESLLHANKFSSDFRSRRKGVGVLLPPPPKKKGRNNRKK